MSVCFLELFLGYFSGDSDFFYWGTIWILTHGQMYRISVKDLAGDIEERQLEDGKKLRPDQRGRARGVLFLLLFGNWLATWVWVNVKTPGDRRSMFPFTRASHFGYLLLTRSHLIVRENSDWLATACVLRSHNPPRLSWAMGQKQAHWNVRDQCQFLAPLCVSHLPLHTSFCDPKRLSGCSDQGSQPPKPSSKHRARHVRVSQNEGQWFWLVLGGKPEEGLPPHQFPSHF